MDKPRPSIDELAREYTAALRTYLQRRDEAGLQRAYELGRRGLSEGVGVLRMSALHHQALADIWPELKELRVPALRAIKHAGHFFTESMSAFEMTHRAFCEANAALRGMNDSLEEEVKRIAHALHDEAGQLLAAVHLSLDQVARDLRPQASEPLRDIKELLEQVGQHMRRLSHELRPTILDDLGLVPAIDFLAEGMAKRSGINITVRSSLPERLPVRLETVLYRVVQEALNNVIRHARARSVNIEVRSSGKVVHCAIIDDGVGFRHEGPDPLPARRGLGLSGMIEKLRPLGGGVKIESAPRQGTKLFITVPREVEYAYSSSRR